MNAGGVLKNLVRRVAGRRTLGEVLVGTAGPGGRFSAAVSLPLQSMPRSHWHWIYLQHLAETVSASADDHDAAMMLATAQSCARSACTESYWMELLGPTVEGALGTSLPVEPGLGGSGGPDASVSTITIVQDEAALPRVRLGRRGSPARLKRSNLLLLWHILHTAADPLEQYQMSRQIEMLARYYQTTGKRRGRSAIRNGPLFAVLHADVARVSTPRRRIDTQIDSVPRRGALPTCRSVAPREPLPAMRCAAVLVACVGTIGLLLAADSPTQQGGGGEMIAQGRPAAGTRTLAGFAPIRGVNSERPRPPAARRAAASRSIAHPERRAASDATPSRRGPFQVRSRPLAKSVAAVRVRVLAEHGVRSFVRSLPGQLAEIDYGVFDSKQYAESQAQRLRQQGYSAVVVPP